MSIYQTTIALSSLFILAACGGEDLGSSALGAADGSVEEGDDGKGKEKVTLCHVPPGNPDNAHTITIGEPAVDAHLDNHEGDHLGPCEGDAGTGGADAGTGGAGGDCPEGGSDGSGASDGTGGSCPGDCLDDCDGYGGCDGAAPCDCLIE